MSAANQPACRREAAATGRQPRWVNRRLSPAAKAGLRGARKSQYQQETTEWSQLFLILRALRLCEKNDARESRSAAIRFANTGRPRFVSREVAKNAKRQNRNGFEQGMTIHVAFIVFLACLAPLREKTMLAKADHDRMKSRREAASLGPPPG